MNLWPHQEQGIADVLAAIARGQRRICLTSPTGGGKSLIMQALARHSLADRRKVVLYSNRKVLIEQLSDTLLEAGLLHGVRAAGHEGLPEHPFQVASIQTEYSRVIKRGTWDLHQADLVLVDEGHLFTNESARKILDRHHEAGAAYVLVTATPVGMAEVADVLIQAGTTSELRKCGALVWAYHYGPDEPDLRGLKGLREGEDLSEGQQKKAMGPRPQLWGRVWEWFEKLNPDRRPTILFGPGVEESIWFAEQFTQKGVRAAHIDGDHIWLDGQLRPSSRTLREEVFDAVRSGAIRVVCNRFVLREGLDLPCLAHGILATVFGSLQSYLQAGGRLLRAHRSLESVTLQDHGGNWWRHGSLNEDREWRLEHTGSLLTGMRADRLRAKSLKEPFTCPKCRRVWTGGTRCNPASGGCGHVLEPGKRSRAVVTTDGALLEMSGDIFRPHYISQRLNGPAKWRQMYFRSLNVKGGRTFRAAFALFARENYGEWPDPSWPYMPKDPEHVFRLVEDVTQAELIR